MVRGVRNRQRLGHPLEPFGQVATHLPEPPQRCGGAERDLAGSDLRCPHQRRAKVVVLLLEPVEPRALAGAHDLARGLFGQLPEQVSVTVAEPIPAPLRHGLVHRELANRLEHREARLPVDALLLAHEAVLDQRGDRVDRIALDLLGTHALDGGQRGTAHEDRQAREHGAIGGVEHVVAPGDRPAQGLLPGGEVAAAALEQPEPPLEARQHRLRREDPDPRRRQLDRQREPVEADADLRHRRGVLVGHLEARLDRSCALDEEGDGLVLREAIERREMRRVRQAERWNRVLLLAGDAQRAAAARQHGEVRRRRQQIRDRGSGGDDLLEVVEDEQHAAIRDVLRQPLGSAAAGPVCEAQLLGDRGGDELGLGDRRELDEEHAVGMVVQRSGRNLQAESRLAGAARAGEGQQAAAPQQVEHLADLSLAPEEGRQPRRQVVRRRSPP